jgi:hypothetical protein
MVTSHQKIAQSLAAIDTQQNEHSLPTSTHLPWNLQSPLSPLYDVMKTLFVCLKELFCLVCCGSSFARLAVFQQPSHMSAPTACLWLGDSHRISRGNQMSATKDLTTNTKLKVTFKNGSCRNSGTSEKGITKYLSQHLEYLRWKAPGLCRSREVTWQEFPFCVAATQRGSWPPHSRGF